MSRFCSFLLLLSLLATSCDKVKDQPEPDLLEGLELKPISMDLVIHGKTDIDILATNPIPEQATIRITKQPMHGSIELDAVRKRFVYSPDSGWSGLDTATYSVCNTRTCKDGRLYFRVSDTTSPCQINLSDYDLVVSPELQELNIPSVFGCSSSITQLIGVNPAWVTLEQGKIKTGFPTYYQDSLRFQYVVCSPDNQCDTAWINLQVKLLPTYCQARFSPVKDVIRILPSFLAFSINYDSLFANDVSCPGDIRPESLTVVRQPARGTATLRSNFQGRFIRYIKDSTFVGGNDTLEYRIEGKSGGSGTAKVIIQIQ